MVNLSEAQERALRYALYSRSAGGYYVNPELISGSTMRALQRHGYIDDALSDGYRFWLTDSGEEKREELVNETCEACGFRSHRTETACLQCGKLKPWAA